MQGELWRIHRDHVSLLVILFITILGFAIYSNTLSSPFIFDDFSSIVNNPSIKNLKDLGTLFNDRQLRFITNLSYALNYRVGGFSVAAYHLVNISIHIAAHFVVFFFMKSLISLVFTQQRNVKVYFPFIVSLIFLTHPIQTQSVTYITQRASSLTGLFSLLSFTFYLKGKTSLVYYFLSILFFLLALYT